MTLAVLDKHIEATPGVCGGKPRIVGHRITVQHIARWHEHQGMSVDEIASAHGLSLADVHAALAFYYDHAEDIHRTIADDDALVERLQHEHASRVQQTHMSRSGGTATPGAAP